MALVQSNKFGPVTMVVHRPGLTTTHDPWRECAMAKQNYTQPWGVGGHHVRD